MMLSALELAYVRSHGLFLTQKCDRCLKLLNQSVHYTVAGRREVYCSAVCRDSVYYGDRHEAMKRATPGKCAYCGATLEKGEKRSDALYCGGKCKKRAARAGKAHSTAEPQIAGTPTQLNHSVASLQKEGQGDCIAGGTKPYRNAPNAVSARSRLSVEVRQ